MKIIKASIIIPVYNAANTIERVLKQLVEIRGQEAVEIIAIDDYSTDSTLQKMQNFTNQITIISCKKNGGRGVARNIGAKAATSSLLIFLDSDCVPSNRNFLQQHILFHQQQRDSALIGYTYTPIEETDDAYIQYRFGLPLPNHPTTKEILPGDFATGNASIEAENFWRVGGFSESLHLYEDVDLALRLYHHGIKFFQNENILIEHLDKNVTYPRDMKRNYLAYNSSVKTISHLNPGNIRYLPLAKMFQSWGHSWWSRLWYTSLLVPIFHMTRKFPSWVPRPIRFMCFSYLVIAAAYNGYWGAQSKFFSTLGEY